ncbi:hypothetical protein TNCV_628951 [Trichonephila clavipes]|nr:hypothetical protein TNCV_628951 [Trichonephila clavipes]
MADFRTTRIVSKERKIPPKTVRVRVSNLDNVTVIQQFLLPTLHVRDLDNVQLQQGGVTAHTSRVSMRVLRVVFP